MQSMKCEICGKIIERKNKLYYCFSKHLSNAHGQNKEQIKNYYDKHIKSEKNGVCKICNRDTKYINFVKGYNIYCDYCSRRKNLKNCKEYWLNRGFSEIDAHKKVSVVQKERSNKFVLSLKENIKRDPEYIRNKCGFCWEYWVKRGYTEKQAKQKIKNQLNNSKKLWKLKYNTPSKKTYYKSL